MCRNIEATIGTSKCSTVSLEHLLSAPSVSELVYFCPLSSAKHGWKYRSLVNTFPRGFFVCVCVCIHIYIHIYMCVYKSHCCSIECRFSCFYVGQLVDAGATSLTCSDGGQKITNNQQPTTQDSEMGRTVINAMHLTASILHICSGQF